MLKGTRLTSLDVAQRFADFFSILCMNVAFLKRHVKVKIFFWFVWSAPKNPQNIWSWSA